MNLSFGSNTNMHKNKVQTRLTLSVKELETKTKLDSKENILTMIGTVKNNRAHPTLR